MKSITITDPNQLIALLEAGADVYGSDMRHPLDARSVLWAWHNDSSWKRMCLRYWLPNGFYSVEVE